MTQATQYQAYRTASQAILDAKETIKNLRKEGEKAATLARHETVGTVQDKLTAIKAAWVPFNAKIAELEAEIAKNYEIADHNFDAYRGLK